MSDSQTIGERLRLLRNEIELSQLEIAERLGVSVRGWQKIERDEAIPGGETLLRLETLGFSPGWILSGSGPMRTSGLIPLAESKDLVEVPFYDLKASAGHGIAIVDEEPKSTFGISERLLRQVGILPPNAAILKSAGDSMAPTITDGSFMIIDRSATYLNTDKVYVLAIENDLFVKRIRREMDGGITLLSDNNSPQFQPQTITKHDLNHLRVIGRVGFIIAPL